MFMHMEGGGGGNSFHALALLNFIHNFQECMQPPACACSLICGTHELELQ